MSEKCDDCGRNYDYIYWVPNHIWEIIKPLYCDQGGLLCLDCVHRRSLDKGIVLRFSGSDQWWGN